MSSKMPGHPQIYHELRDGARRILCDELTFSGKGFCPFHPQGHSLLRRKDEETRTRIETANVYALFRGTGKIAKILALEVDNVLQLPDALRCFSLPTNYTRSELEKAFHGKMQQKGEHSDKDGDKDDDNSGANETTENYHLLQDLLPEEEGEKREEKEEEDVRNEEEENVEKRDEERKKDERKEESEEDGRESEAAEDEREEDEREEGGDKSEEEEDKEKDEREEEGRESDPEEKEDEDSSFSSSLSLPPLYLLSAKTKRLPLRLCQELCSGPLYGGQQAAMHCKTEALPGGEFCAYHRQRLAFLQNLHDGSAERTANQNLSAVFAGTAKEGKVRMLRPGIGGPLLQALARFALPTDFTRGQLRKVYHQKLRGTKIMAEQATINEDYHLLSQLI